MAYPIHDPHLPQWKHHTPNVMSPGGNQSIQAAPGDRFRWAYVINPNPLTIQFEGETEPLRGTPSTVVPVTALLPYTRVWVQQHATRDGIRTVVVGLGKGGNDWVDCTLEDGFQPRENDQDYHPQVKLDGSGLVDFQGQMDPDGLNSTSGAYTKILQLPDGYWPRAEVRWMGFPTSNPHSPYGGYISRADGGLYIRNDTTNSNWPPTEHWCIVIQPWEPVPAAPY